MYQNFNLPNADFTRNHERPEELLEAEDEEANNFKVTNPSTMAKLRP